MRSAGEICGCHREGSGQLLGLRISNGASDCADAPWLGLGHFEAHVWSPIVAHNLELLAHSWLKLKPT